MSVKWTKLGLAGAAIVVLAAGVFIYARSDRAHPADTRPVEPTPVIATNVQQHDVPIILTSLGTVTALTRVREQHRPVLLPSVEHNGQPLQRGGLVMRRAHLRRRRNVNQLAAAAYPRCVFNSNVDGLPSRLLLGGGRMHLGDISAGEL